MIIKIKLVYFNEMNIFSYLKYSMTSLKNYIYAYIKLIEQKDLS